MLLDLADHAHLALLVKVRVIDSRHDIPVGVTLANDLLEQETSVLEVRVSLLDIRNLEALLDLQI